MKPLIIASTFAILAVCIHEFIVVFLKQSRPWLSWPVGAVVFVVTFIALAEYETRPR